MTEERTKGLDEKFCTSCGQAIKSLAEICPHCGVRQMHPPSGGESAAVPVILNGVLGFFGFMGIGHMVAGAVGRGILLLLIGWGLVVLTVVLGLVTFGLAVVPLWIIALIVWIWSMFDVRSVVAKKTQR